MPASLPWLALSGVRFTTARKWLKVGLVPVALLVGAGLASRFVVPTTAPSAEPVSAPGRAALKQCVRDAFLLYDVHWSAACMLVSQEEAVRHEACLNDPAIMGNATLGKEYCDRTFPPRDNTIDCDLPDERAASVNALLADAQQQCQAEAKKQ